MAGFQCVRLASGLSATPASPRAPERESGEIIRNGTAVVIALIYWLTSWPFNWLGLGFVSCARAGLLRNKASAKAAIGKRNMIVFFEREAKDKLEKTILIPVPDVGTHYYVFDMYVKKLRK